MSNVFELTESNFDEHVVTTSGLAVVDFWAPWCGPCRKLAPILDEIATEFDGQLSVFKINVDENLEIAKRYSVSGLPSVLIFQNGEPVERLVGLIPKTSILNNINKHLS